MVIGKNVNLRDRIITEIARPLPVSEGVTRRIYKHLEKMPANKSPVDILNEISANIDGIRKKASWDYLLGTGSQKRGVVGNIIESWYGAAEQEAEERRKRRLSPEQENKRNAARQTAKKFREQYAIQGQST